MSSTHPAAETLAVEAEPIEPQPLHMTYEEFLVWAGEDVHAEWVNGEVIAQMPPKDPHQTLIEFLHHVLGLFIRIFDLGRLRLAPFELRLRPDGPAREPDLMFLAKTHLDRLTPERVAGPPDLVIEVVSDDSLYRDRVDKFDEYEAAGVPEYWVLDNRPGQQRAWFYQLDRTGRYQPVQPDAQGIYRSVVLPGFWLRVEWLWEAQPDALRALGEIVGLEQFVEALRRTLQG